MFCHEGNISESLGVAIGKETQCGATGLLAPHTPINSKSGCREGLRCSASVTLPSNSEDLYLFCSCFVLPFSRNVQGPKRLKEGKRARTQPMSPKMDSRRSVWKAEHATDVSRNGPMYAKRWLRNRCVLKRVRNRCMRKVKYAARCVLKWFRYRCTYLCRSSLGAGML